MSWEDVSEWMDLTDPDRGPCVNNIPFIGNLFDKTCEKKEDCRNVNKVDKYDLAIGGIGAAGGGIIGYKLGEDFGTLGKLAGGVIGAWVGCKLTKETAKDVAAASDYVENNSKDGNKAKISKFEATISNMMNVKGQTYTGKTNDADSDLDAT